MQHTESEILNLLSTPSTKEKGFNMLMKTFQKQMYWQIKELTQNHEDTNDVLQNVMVKVWKYIDRFKKDSKLATWLYRIARNESITFLNKKNNRNIANLNEETKDYVFDSLQAEVEIDSDTVYNTLKAAIAILPKKQKLVFELRYFKEMKYKDMAKELSLTEGALKASYHHAVKKIESILKED
ncbi:MAG: RNA polymerase sigma-70 factor (ECF subfamily) [Planctomycetota bacterium]|jgi:RNA polymerase sigma-70 factor (ECF subfamily)